MDKQGDKKDQSDSPIFRTYLAKSSSHVEAELDRLWERRRQQENDQSRDASSESKENPS